MSQTTDIPKLPALLTLAACLVASGPVRAQSGYEVVHTFSGNRGRPFAAPVQGPDGRLYGTTVAGGFFGKGSVFATDASGNATTLHAFDGSDGEAPRGRLLLASDGNFYGTTSQGANGFGTIFRLTPGGVLTTLVRFTGANGAFPQSGLLQAHDGMLYGTTLAGGPGESGTVFRLLADGTLAIVASFTGVNGAFPIGELLEAADQTIYGTTEQGGANGRGTVFQISAGTTTTLASFTGVNGAFPRDGLIQTSGGELFGMTVRGGAGDRGTLFRLAPDGSVVTVVGFSGANGALPLGGLRELADGFLYGTTQEGGAGFGTLFRLLATDDHVTTLASFGGSDGGFPRSGVMQTLDGTIYGTTEHGGAGGYGTVFRFTSGLPLATVVAFTGAAGADPSGRLIQADDGNFYGTTVSGGASGFGTVFRLTPDGLPTTIASFDWSNGAFPSGGLVQASDGLLYGTTEEGGGTGEGTAFSVTLDGTLTSLVSFDSFVNGAVPLGGLIEATDGNLYGTTLFGPNGLGTVFRLTPAGSVTTQIEFDDTNGAFPTSGVIQGADGALYGTTEQGGADGFGTVFRLEGSTLSTLVSFNDVNGAFPAARLLLASNGKFYGTTSEGGATGDGTIFELTPGGDFATVASFDGANGSFPYQQGVIEARDGRLYGTTMGRPEEFGTVYRLENGTIVPIHSFDGVTGAHPNVTLMEAGDGALYGTAAAPFGGIVFRFGFDAGVILQVAPATATYGGVTTLSATLTTSGGPVVGAEVVFELRGVVVGAGTTDSAGIAKLPNVSIAGLDAGTYAAAVTALSDGTGTLVEATGDLIIAKATPTVTLTGATYTYDAQPHPASGNVTGVLGETLGPLVFTYNGAVDVPVDPRSYTVIVSYAGNINYHAASGTAVITILPPEPGVAGLVAAYAFNEGGGVIAADASGKRHIGAIFEAQYVTNGRFGGALLFDGIDDWVTIADASDLDFTTGLTMEAWVNPSVLSGWNTIALKEGPVGGLAYALYANDMEPQPAGYIRTSTGGDWPVTGTEPVPLNEWTHLALTYDGAMLRFYVNGTEATRRTVTGKILATTGPLRIGGNAVFGEFLQGMIDEFRMYGRALSPSEIQRDMNMPIAFETTAPTVAITSPLDGAVLAGMPAVTVTATDNARVASVKLQVDGVDIEPALAAAPFVFRLNAANGWHVVKAIAKDTAGNIAISDPVNVKIANIPVADYSFDEGGAIVLDVSGHGNDGTMSVGVRRISDPERGNVLSFDGINGMVTVPDSASLDLRTGVTLEAWGKTAALSGWRSLILKEAAGLAYALYANQDVSRPAGFVHIGTLDRSVQGNSQLSPGVWTHLAMTYDGTTMRMFVNGVEVARRQQTGVITVSNGALRIGGNAIWGEWFKGLMDDVRIYDVAVGAAQVKADMNASR